jgi:Fe-S cluster assembly protein SufD
MTMAQVVDKLQPWMTAIAQRPQGGTRWLQDLRDKAAARFTALGFPSVRDEEWRFTNIAPIASTEFQPASRIALEPSALDALPYASAPFRITVLNGRFSAELSRLNNLPRGVRAGSLAAAVSEHADVVPRYYGQLADYQSRAFVALNTALAADGAYLYIPEGTVLEQPVEILFLSAGDSASVEMTNARLLIVAAERSQARIVETYAALRNGVYFTNAVTEIVAAESAIVDHYKIQQESLDAYHVATVHIHAQRSATVASHSFSLGGKLVRNDANAVLDGEGAEVTLNGLYLADGDRLVDNHTSIDHAKAHCPSHEIYKGILGGRARAIFNGKIIVRPDAQKTDAKQTNRALLLSDDASINTKPQLEIFADDVKCTHGAAIGQLDEDAIFYLRARGLTYFEARDMMIHAFAGEIIDRVQIDDLRRALEAELYAQLAKDLAELDAA